MSERLFRCFRWRGAAVLLGAAALLAAPGARAEYVENGMARTAETWLLATAGATALLCDVGSVVYLSGAVEGLAGRLTFGIGAMVAGAAEAVAGGLLSIGISKSAVPGGYDEYPDSSEAEDYRAATALAAVNVAIGATSVVLGVITTATSSAGDADASDSETAWTAGPMLLSPTGHPAAGAVVGARF